MYKYKNNFQEINHKFDEFLHNDFTFLIISGKWANIKKLLYWNSNRVSNE